MCHNYQFKVKIELLKDHKVTTLLTSAILKIVFPFIFSKDSTSTQIQGPGNSKIT